MTAKVEGCHISTFMVRFLIGKDGGNGIRQECGTHQHDEAQCRITEVSSAGFTQDSFIQVVITFGTKVKKQSVNKLMGRQHLNS